MNKSVTLLLNLLACAACAAVLTGAASAAAAESEPNIVLILADDIGYGDVGCYGALPKNVLTPHIDQLAKQGVRFTDAHAPSSVCTPSRYALLTGQYAFRNRKAWEVLPADAPLAIAPGAYTLPQMFRSNGYTTGLVGKWHLGLGGGGKTIDWNGDIKPGPLEVGFDSAFYLPATGDRVPTVLIRDHRVENLDPADPIEVSYKSKIGNEPTGSENPAQANVLLGNKGAGHEGTITNGVSRIGWMKGGRKARWTDDELMDRLTDETVGFIEKNKAKPFFLYFATHGIHEPRVPAKRFVGKSGAGVYGDQIEELDDAVGRVLKTLDDLKLADNTLVIFSSDNGGSLVDMRGYRYGKRANLHGHKINGTLSGGKYSALEGGTRVPLIVRWPGHAPAGSDSTALVSLMDLQASFARLIGAKLPDSAAPDSADVLDALLGKIQVGRHELIEHKYGPTCALRSDNWKFLDGQLFNLADDLSESHNLAKAEPERAKAMAARLNELRAAGKSR